MSLHHRLAPLLPPEVRVDTLEDPCHRDVPGPYRAAKAVRVRAVRAEGPLEMMMRLERTRRWHAALRKRLGLDEND